MDLVRLAFPPHLRGGRGAGSAGRAVDVAERGRREMLPGMPAVAAAPPGAQGARPAYWFPLALFGVIVALPVPLYVTQLSASPAFSGWVAYAPLSRTVSWSAAQVGYSSSFSVLLQSDTGLRGHRRGLVLGGRPYGRVRGHGGVVPPRRPHRTWLAVPGHRCAADRGGHRGPTAGGTTSLAAQMALAVQRVVARYVRSPGHRPRPVGAGPPRPQPPAGHRRAGLHRGSPGRGLAGPAQRPVSAHR